MGRCTYIKEINLISLIRISVKTTQAEMKEIKGKVCIFYTNSKGQTDGERITNYNFISNRIRQTNKAKNSSNCDHHQA
jgi:hypothetical protein